MCPLDTVMKAKAWMLALSCTIWPECCAHGCSWWERNSGKAKENHSLLYRREGALVSTPLIPGSASSACWPAPTKSRAGLPLWASHVVLTRLEKLRDLCS